MNWRIASVFLTSFLLSTSSFAAEPPIAGRTIPHLPAASTPYALPSPPEDSLEYSADHFEYDASTPAAMELAGDVRLKESTWTIRAGRLRLDLDHRVGSGSGGIELDDGLSRLRGDSGSFDFERREGRLAQARAEYPPWRLWSRDAFLDSRRRATFKRARFTSCADDPPHYHFRASRVRVRPGKWLYATNARFYLGGAPVFYSPFLWKSLRRKHLLPTKVAPGYDRRNGPFARTTTLYSIRPELYGRLYLDYYASQGPAAGSELFYHASEDGRGTLYGYRVGEEGGGPARWAVLGSHYQTLFSTYAFQARLQTQSDPEFNNHYQRASALRVTPELVNSAAVVRRTPFGTARLSYSRLDSADGRGGFQRNAESSPRLDFQTAPTRVSPIPFLWTFALFADNQYDRARSFQQRSAGGSAETTRTFNLARGVSLTPRAAFREAFEDKREALTTLGSTRTYRDVFVGRYDLGTNLRLGTPAGDWDLGYDFARRLKADTLQDDSGAVDHGVERSLVSVQDTLRPSRRSVLRLVTGYDFRKFRDRALGFRERVQPFVADLLLTPRRGVSVALRDEYRLQDGNRAFLFHAEAGERDSSYVAAGLGHTKDHPRDYFASNEFAWTPKSSTWRLGGALRLLVDTAGGASPRDLRAFEKELWVSKDFHDFFARALFRIRPGGVKEVNLRFELRISHENRSRVERKDQEAEWYPERKGKGEER